MKGVRKRISFRIGLIFTAIVMGEILVTVGIASLLSGLLDITGISPLYGFGSSASSSAGRCRGMSTIGS